MKRKLNKTQKIRNLIIMFTLAFGLFSQSTIVKARANAHVYRLEDYKEALQDYNSKNATSYEIKDYQAFNKNILNKVSPNELLNTLANFDDNAQSDSQDSCSEAIINAEPNTTVRYYKVLRMDGYSGTFYADIETRFPNENKRYFVKYARAGVIKESNGYYFSPMSIKCISCTSKLCTVRYKGCWVNGKNGLTDNVLRTIDVPFQPWEVY